MENHFHGRVLLIDENGMIGAVVKKDTEPLSVEIVLVSHLHREIGAENIRG